MTLGRAAKFAYDPKVLVAFFDANTSYRTDGHPKRRRRYINHQPCDINTDGRMIRRWRNQTQGVTHASAVRMLDNFNLTVSQLHHWATSAGMTPVLRGRIT